MLSYYLYIYCCIEPYLYYNWVITLIITVMLMSNHPHTGHSTFHFSIHREKKRTVFFFLRPFFLTWTGVYRHLPKSHPDSLSICYTQPDGLNPCLKTSNLTDSTLISKFNQHILISFSPKTFSQCLTDNIRTSPLPDMRDVKCAGF